MGNSLGRAPLAGSETEAWTSWTDRKPSEITGGEHCWEGGRRKRGHSGRMLGESSVGRKRGHRGRMGNRGK